MGSRQTKTQKCPKFVSQKCVATFEKKKIKSII